MFPPVISDTTPDSNRCESFRANAPRHSKNKGGFTLLELLITVAIAAVLLGIASPSYSVLVEKSKHRSYADQLFHLVQYTRTTAVNHKKQVVICEASGNTAGACSKDKVWDSEVIVFINNYHEPNLPVSFDPDKGDLLIRQISPPPPDMTLRATRPYLSFFAPGTTNTAASLHFCNKNNGLKHGVYIYSSGRARFARESEIVCITKS